MKLEKHFYGHVEITCKFDGGCYRWFIDMLLNRTNGLSRNTDCVRKLLLRYSAVVTHITDCALVFFLGHKNRLRVSLLRVKKE